MKKCDNCGGKNEGVQTRQQPDMQTETANDLATDRARQD